MYDFWSNFEKAIVGGSDLNRNKLITLVDV